MYRFGCAFYCKIYQGNKLLNNNYYPSMNAYAAKYYLWMLFNKITSYRGEINV